MENNLNKAIDWFNQMGGGLPCSFIVDWEGTSWLGRYQLIGEKGTSWLVRSYQCRPVPDQYWRVSTSLEHSSLKVWIGSGLKIKMKMTMIYLWISPNFWKKILIWPILTTFTEPGNFPHFWVVPELVPEKFTTENKYWYQKEILVPSHSD